LTLNLWCGSAALPGAGPAEGAYTNPVGGEIRMGDPFVLRHDSRYYLYGTAGRDGFLSWTSADMVHWQAAGYAYQKTENSWCGKTFWAPEVVHYRNRFYMVFSCQPAEAERFSTRISLAVSDKPEGPFRDLHSPLFDRGWAAIDGHIFIDQDGRPYVYFMRAGSPPAKGGPPGRLQGRILGAALKEDLSGLAGDPVLCLTPEQGWETPERGRSHANEGPTVFRHDGRYYMTYSANHYAEPDYGIGYATAAHPLGPWTKSGANPLVAKDLAKGVSGPGHNSITLSPDGTELFMVYHAHANPARPSGQRDVNIDRLVFDIDGRLRLIGPTRTPQPLPSASK
jgi:GH43 family beta-xylosidase